jgi:signal transduction histidine kinase
MESTQISVLLVEDSASDAELFRKMFIRSGKGGNLLHVERLSEAVDACDRQTFNVVLLDLNLPDSEGLNTLAEFRATVPNIPVVVLTMMDDEKLALQAMTRGAQDYLVKDQITIQLLVRSLRYAIERGEILKQLKDSEQNILQALEQEQKLNLLKSNFISIASHEFRTPMTTIRNSMELLQFNLKLTEEKRNTYFELVKTAINQIIHLIDEVLLLGSTEMGGLKYDPAPLNLKEFCHELIDALQVNTDEQCFITFTHQGNCDSVEMDETLLRHILSNLLSNAIKYSPKSEEVKLDLNYQANTVIFQIQDRGIGIPVDDQLHLFEAFYRCSNVGKIQGSGLGLAIAKKCIDLHQGEIQVSSEINVGTNFRVILPSHSRN